MLDIWHVDIHSKVELKKNFDLIETGDWKDRKYSPYQPKEETTNILE